MFQYQLQLFGLYTATAGDLEHAIDQIVQIEQWIGTRQERETFRVQGPW